MGAKDRPLEGAHSIRQKASKVCRAAKHAKRMIVTDGRYANGVAIVDDFQRHGLVIELDGREANLFFLACVGVEPL